MTRIKSLLITLTIACGLVNAADNQLSDSEQQDGWKLLFNGKDLSEWRNYQKKDIDPRWKVVDGTIQLTGKGGGDIMTKSSFDNFKLKLDWKISSGGNSGIFFMVDELGSAIYSHAPEVQILDNERHSDREIDSHRSGSLYDLIAAPAASQKPAGEWNSVVIRYQNKHLTVWQNGIVTASIVIDSSSWNTLVKNSKFANWTGFASGKGGHLGLQDHGDIVWFKNIKIKEL